MYNLAFKLLDISWLGSTLAEQFLFKAEIE